MTISKKLTDQEALEIVKEAKRIGLSLKEVREFIKQNTLPEKMDVVKVSPSRWIVFIDGERIAHFDKINNRKFYAYSKLLGESNHYGAFEIGSSIKDITERIAENYKEYKETLYI